MEEYLDVVDEFGVPTGKVVKRTIAHRDGIRHRTAHVWLFHRRNGVVEVLLQKRCMTKDTHPGCYDISSAGHIPAGSDFIPSAIRELKEELGLTVMPEELHLVGQRRFRYVGDGVIDCQVSNVYLLWKDVEAEQLQIQKSELESVSWMPFADCIEAVANNRIRHCIWMEELELLQQGLKKCGVW
ncbi:MAG: NUDIX hydrolase [Oscillospiraceae bacterium]